MIPILFFMMDQGNRGGGPELEPDDLFYGAVAGLVIAGIVCLVAGVFG